MSDPISSDVGVIAKCLLASRGGLIAARDHAIARKSSSRVVGILERAAVGSGNLNDGVFGEVLADWRISSSAFFSSLRARSIFFRLLDSGFTKVPLRTPLGIVTASATGWIVAEGNPVPVSKLSLASPTLQPFKAAALIVVSAAVAESMDEAAYQLVNSELRGAVSDIVDAEFFDRVTDSSTPSFSSVGNSKTDIAADLLQLLDAVNHTGAGTLLWAMAPGVANALSVAGEPFNSMTPVGGELLGLPAYVSATVPSGVLRLINAGRIAANAETIRLDASSETSIQMSTNPTNNTVTPTGAELVSMFHTGSVALKAVVDVGVERIDEAAVAELTDIEWGQSGS